MAAALIRARILSSMKSGRASIRMPRAVGFRGANSAHSDEVMPLRALEKASEVTPKGAKNPNGSKSL